MTKEEKAKIENPYKKYNGEWMQGYLSGMFEEGFVKGVNWQEREFRKYLETKKKDILVVGDEPRALRAEIALLDEIINELF